MHHISPRRCQRRFDVPLGSGSQRLLRPEGVLLGLPHEGGRAENHVTVQSRLYTSSSSSPYVPQARSSKMSGMDSADQLEIVGRLACAAFLGGLIGLERELRGYPAGVRTIALVAFGSTLFTEVSALTAEQDRIAAGIVSGIGFIGAGVIFREGGSIRGITTAATIWAAAAIGMAVGRDLYIVAGFGSLIVFLLLESRAVVRNSSRALRKRFPILVGLADEDDGGQEHL